MPWSIRGREPASTRLVGAGTGSGGPERTIERRQGMRKDTEAGIDVRKDVLDAAARRDGTRVETARFDNDAAGHRTLVRWLTTRSRTVRVVLESTGTYSLDVALALHRARGIAVMVVNPRAVKHFAGALRQRSKTDLTAAAALPRVRRAHAVRGVTAARPGGPRTARDRPTHRGPR